MPKLILALYRRAPQDVPAPDVPKTFQQYNCTHTNVTSQTIIYPNPNQKNLKFVARNPNPDPSPFIY